jgi:hypothetical protein
MSQGVQQHLFDKPYEPYSSLAKHFENNNMTELLKCIEDNKETLQKDNNYGLAKQLKLSLVKHRIIKISKTYDLISLTDIIDIANEDINDNQSILNNDQITQLILKLNFSGIINCAIDMCKGWVRFNNRHTLSLVTQTNLVSQLNDLNRIQLTLRQLHKDLLTSPLVVSFSMREGLNK